MINFYALLLKYLDMKLELSVKFYDEMISKLRQNKNYIEKRYKEEEVSEGAFNELLDSLVGDYHEQEELENLTRMLVLSHRYFLLEHFLKLLVGNLLKQEGDPDYERYKRLYMGDIVKFFSERGIVFVSIDGYKNCDVLHKIVNAIKHNGARATKELADARGEPFDETEIKEIRVSPDEITRYSEAIKQFFGGLINLVEDKAVAD